MLSPRRIWLSFQTPADCRQINMRSLRFLGGVGSSVWSSKRLEAVLLGFWTASEATSWRSRLGAEAPAERLPFITTQLDFEPLRRPVGVPHH